MTSDILLTDTPHPHVLRLTLNRPHARNALATPLLRAVAEALTDAAADDAVRAVVVTGGERVFAAGADIGELAAHSAVSVLADERPRHWTAIRRFPKPLIAAVNGYALGGGCELAMHADIIVAGDTAQFGQPEINLGLIPGAGGTQRLTHAVGKALAMRMVLTGQPIDAQAALAAGLVAEVTPAELSIERAVALAARIADKPPVAVRLAKQAVLASFEPGLEQGLAHERQAFALLFATEDMREGVTAFLDKRTPSFRGR
ncbi:enoyl-CoA hydratase-related protein [Azospirillum sp. ST 5-10]|uniref:enoyl-CoA hydratase-related protein n=1 Tax=unclassified Azospirillum TaxID=2630922 RepID=UPI003F4A639E